MTPSMILGWVESGDYFGYPSCCTGAFVVQAIKKLTGTYTPLEQKRNFTGTGFIPCDRCNQLPKEQVVAEINAARVKCLKPFRDRQQ